MKNIIMTAILSIGVMSVAWADNTSQKNAIEQKYNEEINNENQDYAKKVANAKQNDYNDPNKLNNELKELEIQHNKNLDDIKNNEQMDLQKASE